MAVTITKKRGIPQPSEPLKVCSIKLPSTALHLLHDLSQEASDAIGRPVTSSTLVRALLRYLTEQPASWTAKQLHPLIEEEIEAGRIWGTKGKTAPRGEIAQETTPDTVSTGKGKEAGKGRKPKG